MDVVIRINMDNAAFVEHQGKELSEVLHTLASKVCHVSEFTEEYDMHITALDTNGNTIGAMDIVKD